MIRVLNLILTFLLPSRVVNMYKKQRDIMRLRKWELSGCPVPPPNCVKQFVVAKYRDEYYHKLFIETGTYKGEMIESQIDRFERIISIELDYNLYLEAKKKFSSSRKVRILHGDSAKIIREVLSQVNEPAIFWLDAHYSGGVTAKGDKESPILEELDAILDTKFDNHVILIDDARCFDGTKDYPTLESLKEFLRLKNSKYSIRINNDIICCERES